MLHRLIMHSLSNSVKNGARDIMRDNVVSDMVLDIFAYFIQDLGMEDQVIRTLMFVSQILI